MFEHGIELWIRNNYKENSSALILIKNVLKVLLKLIISQGIDNFIFILDFLDKSPELGERRIQGLSRRISQKEELRVLAMKGLHMDDYVLDYHLVKNKQNVRGAAYSLLKDWLSMHSNRQVAYARLAEALKGVNMAFYVSDVLENGSPE